ncbi:helix-turn-helix domain-containing protein [Acidaminococcus intestini]|nr:helix-turn-helix domain-containing protein [Acidaminococcus intestini]
MPKENSTHQVDPMDKWVSIEQAANYLGVSVVTVRSWLREKRGIPAVKIGKQWKFRLSDLEKWVTSGGSQFGSDKRKNKKDDRFPKELVIFLFESPEPFQHQKVARSKT